MPETKEETLREIDRLHEWCLDMEDMLDNDGTVPTSMVAIYERQRTAGLNRLYDLKNKARENGWSA
jgi:hypothetical protein